MSSNFPILDISDISIEEETDKLNEEVEEFIEAIKNQDEENTIEEFYDIIQVIVNIVDKLGISNKLDEGLDIHIEKIKNRDWDIIKFL